jgi:hypothetical protein
MTSYARGYAAAQEGRDPSPPTTEPARGLYMDGYRDQVIGLCIGADGWPYDPSDDKGARSVGVQW